MDGHHTARVAFARAHDILVDLQAHGVDMPRFELYVDGSGRLVLGPQGTVTRDQYQRAVELVFSERMDFGAAEVAIRFCCGLVEHDGTDECAEDSPPVVKHIDPPHDHGNATGSSCCRACCGPGHEGSYGPCRLHPEPCATCRGKGFTCSCGDPDHVPCQSNHRAIICPECGALASRATTPDPRDRAAWLDQGRAPDARGY